VDRRHHEAASHDVLELGFGAGDAAARTAHGEGGADDGGNARLLDRRLGLSHRLHDRAAGDVETDAVHGLFEELSILPHFDGAA
jgi:hypothetical protein